MSVFGTPKDFFSLTEKVIDKNLLKKDKNFLK